MSELITRGTKAPQWEASASDGKSYKLSDVLKRDLALLIFYPGNNTPG